MKRKRSRDARRVLPDIWFFSCNSITVYIVSHHAFIQASCNPSAKKLKCVSKKRRFPSRSSFFLDNKLNRAERDKRQTRKGQYRVGHSLKILIPRARRVLDFFHGIPLHDALQLSLVRRSPGFGLKTTALSSLHPLAPENVLWLASLLLE
jgi:hypothetical protein